ncbi:MAG: ubiquinol-cytochrome c reductase iron-sulfur subunit [Candidatus Azotimanducaceae bacterium]|jgi:ubiquinol-cytochrome c reductase iron-sulfur subunit
MKNRRGLLTRIVQGFSITGAGFLTYPFIKAWIPKFDNDISLEVRIDDLLPGQSKTVRWLGRNLFVLRRTQQELSLLKDQSSDLKDPKSIESKQPAFALNQYRSLRPDIFVVFNNCTHLGCEVNRKGAVFNCPCHQSDYDGAGRVVSKAVAPTNLEIPEYKFVSGNRIRLLVSEV